MLRKYSLLTLASFTLFSCTHITDKYKPAIISDFTKYRSDHHPKTQQQTAESLLKVIHRFKDDKVVLTIHTTLTPSTGTEINVYRYHSEWYGDWLSSFIILDDGYHHIELRSGTTSDRISKEQEFYRHIIELSNNNSP